MKYAVAAFGLGALYAAQWLPQSTVFTRDQILVVYTMIGSVALVGWMIGAFARHWMRPRQAFPERVMDAVRELEIDQPEGMSGYEISREIGAGGFGTLYASLHKLERDGVLTSWWSDESERRRLYRRVVR